MFILVNILVLFVEALFFYIPLKEIKEIKIKKDKLKLYIVIFLDNILCTLIFGTTIFRYIVYPLIIFIFLKLIDKKTRFYDFFIITFLMGFKLLIEFIFMYLTKQYIINYYVYLVICMQIICLFILYLSKFIINKIYIKICKNWDCNKKFYLRYIMIIIFNSLIIFFVYNLIKIKEVL